MKILKHKNENLTFNQKFFIEKSIELLHVDTIDTYSVRLNNSYTILKELKDCLFDYIIGKIKHFNTIKGKERDSPSIRKECINLIDSDNSFLKYKSISKEFLKSIVEQLDERNYLKTIKTLEIVLNENENYLDNLLSRIIELIHQNSFELENLIELDYGLSFLYSQLIFEGYSKEYLFQTVNRIFNYNYGENNNFNENWGIFKNHINNSDIEYKLIFRIDTSTKVHEAISEITPNDLMITNQIEDLKIKQQKEYNNFKAEASNRKFLQFTIQARDHFSVIKKGRQILAEYLDIINLGFPNEFLHIYKRVVVININNASGARLQNITFYQDGFYKKSKEYYLELSNRVPHILESQNIKTESKDKIKSAIRYLRLGNESIEFEHKFINYWIGIEYLFSSYDSNDTINRIKEHFINAHSRAYIKRNITYILTLIKQIDTEDLNSLENNNVSLTDFINVAFFDEFTKKLKEKYPLIGYRIERLKDNIIHQGKMNTKKYITKHRENLEIHFTRIYRIRNEIIHDALFNTNNSTISSNLRYYLTFILNELIEGFNKNSSFETIEDIFMSYEIEIENIKHKGYKLNDYLNVNCSLNYIL